MASTPRFVGNPRTEILTLVPGHGTRPRPLVVPGASGSRITKIGISTDDAGNNKVQFSIGKVRTLASAMGTGAFTDGGGSDDGVSRSSGSFVADGWLVGQSLLVYGATTLANDFLAELTSVSALALGVATNTVNAVENLPNTAELYEIVQSWYVDVALGSGLPSVVGVSGLNTTQAPFFDTPPDTFLDLGADAVLFASVNTLMGSGESMKIFAELADF